MLVMGLDEAGRGSVLGPLVVGAYWVDQAAVSAVKAAGADDSKRLSHKRREALIEPLSALGSWALRVITPAEIDAANINQLEEQAFISLILEQRPDKVIIDAPCHPRGIPAFKQRLLRALGYSPELVVEPKADGNYAPCGAASIFAKVHRDRAMASLGPRATYGSGYPSDPVTRAWLTERIRTGEPLPDCVRTRWGTIAVLSQQVLFPS